MSAKRKKIIKIVGSLILAGFIIGGSIGLYMFFMPHRDVQKAKTDYALDARELVREYLDNKLEADRKYLSEDGNSKILEITGTVARVSEDYAGQKVVLLQASDDPAGINFTFLKAASTAAETLVPGQRVRIKGVIRSGVSFDPALDMYLHAVVEQSAVISKN